MATNREKYINNAANKELVDFLIDVNLGRCNICSKNSDCQKINRECIDADCKKGITEWLSQPSELMIPVGKKINNEILEKIKNIIFQIEYLKAYIVLDKEKEVNNIISELEALKLYFMDEEKRLNFVTEAKIENTGHLIKETQKALLKLTELVQKLEKINIKTNEGPSILSKEQISELMDNTTFNYNCKDCKIHGVNIIKCNLKTTCNGYIRYKNEYIKENWIVHRTLRKQNKETYVSLDRSGYGLRNYDTPFDHYELYGNTNRKQAKGFSRGEAILIRDMLNEKRVGRRYLWVINKVEEDKTKITFDYKKPEII